MYGVVAVLVLSMVISMVLHSSLDLGMFLRRSHFFIIIEKKINKSPAQIMFTSTFSPWARTLEIAIWYQNEGQILTLIFNNIDFCRLF